VRHTNLGVRTSLLLICIACSGTDATAPGRLRAVGGAERTVSTDAACGATIVLDLRLEEDLTCSGDGLIVGQDDIKINLNGHTIRGGGTGIGITVRGRSNVDVYGGTVRGFLTGIMIATSTGVVIKDNGFTQNREAVFLAGAVGNTIKSNAAWQNTQRGIMIRPTGSGVLSTGNVVVDNVLTSNPSGILVFGQPNNTIKANTISQSTVAGLDLTGGGASGNIFKDNLLMNSAAGIKFGAGWTDNNFVANRLLTNTCGVQGTSSGNVFKENTFSGNVTDWCP
jgi:parallel beta-helix repeat protein